MLIFVFLIRCRCGIGNAHISVLYRVSRGEIRVEGIVEGIRGDEEDQ